MNDARPPEGGTTFSGESRSFPAPAPRFDLEATLQALRDARHRLLADRIDMRQVGEIVDRTVDNVLADGFFTDPQMREAAGVGALIAGVAFQSVTSNGREAMILNFVTMFGQSLVDHARAETGARP